VIGQRDVAAVAVRVLTDDGYSGAQHVLTGPQVLSRAEQVRMIGAALGRPLVFEEVPVPVARAQMLADGEAYRAGGGRGGEQHERDPAHASAGRGDRLAQPEIAEPGQVA
jgi:uncharacterized protein YbjT (DUF2867 family)